MGEKRKKIDPKIEFDNSVHEEINNKLKRNKCMYEGCTSNAIWSHSISRSISLGEIARNGILLSPKSERAYPNKKYFIDEIGYRGASGFFGFCEVHDNILFEELDNHSIQTTMDIVTQLYRSVNYHYFNDSAQLIAQTRPLERLGKWDLALNAINKNKIYLSRLKNFQKELFQLMHYHDYLKVTPNPLPMTKSKISNIIIFYKKLNFQVPIAINTIYSYGSNNEEFDLFVTNIPYKDSTDFLMMIDARYYNYFNDMLNYIFNADINILNYIERVMMSSEHWWLKPEIYEQFSEEKKRIVQEDLYCYAGLENEYDISIFDDIRYGLITGEPQFDHEREKLLSSLPERAPFEKRKNNMDYEIVAKILRSKKLVFERDV
ncbi:hypothetical protein [Paenibacillus illinoisensis]|uniref:hypothetical protein n=1 Tax=Paenibacillus illinoisensis TaxID=59845 RepID=UPI00301B80B7